MNKKNSWILGVIIACYCLYVGLFIWKTSFIIDGDRYFCLFDDAMISMRYARNLAAGYGLVWNPLGERVEGFTNLGWVLIMAFFHLFELPENLVSLSIQIFGAILLFFNLMAVKRLAGIVCPEHDRFCVLAAVFFTAFYYPLIYWSIMGMEVSLLTLMITLSACQFLLAVQKHKIPWSGCLILALGTWFRMDMAVPFATAMAWYIWACYRDGKREWQVGFVFGLLALLIALSSQTIFRMLYFGDWLPNTYYLKMEGYPALFRVTRGILVTFWFLWGFLPLVFLIPFVTHVLKSSPATVLLVSIFGFQVFYSIWVGGDTWEYVGKSNRFVTIAMPCLFVFVGFLLSQLRTALRTVVAEPLGLTRASVNLSMLLLLLL